MIRNLLSKKTIERLILGSVFLLLFFGGLGLDTDFLLYLSSIIFTLLIIITYLSKGKISFPQYFKLYFVFLLVLFFSSILWSLNTAQSLKYTLLFASGAQVWIIVHNNKIFLKYFPLAVLLLGIVYAFLYFFHRITKTINPSHLSLFLPITNSDPHNHIGDISAIACAPLIYTILKKKKIVLSIITLLVFLYLMIISHSRSAYMSFIVVVSVLFNMGGYFKKYKRHYYSFVVVGVVLFLISGLGKSVLQNRPYYLQGIRGFFEYPLGVGVGNFGYISSEFITLGNGVGASYAFSMVFELISGVGWLSFIFFYMIWKISQKMLLSERNLSNTVISSVYFGFLINFMFDYTYFIPSMFWIWFGTFGMVSDRKK